MTDIAERLRAALADRYVLERELGAGGMATVYLARDLKHQRPVAVKVLHPELTSALGPGRFLREITISAGLTHPHLLPLHDSGEADGYLYYVMPFIEGASLRERITREKQLPLEDALQIAREVADALSYAHERGVVHRDIKPENILFQSGHALVTDFGIALAVRAASGKRLTQTGIAIGTPAYMSPEQASGTSYMSPEQASGTRDLDGRSDQYSLGCVLYEMLAGDPPFTGPTPQALIAKKLHAPLPHVSVVRESVPPHVEKALLRAMARTPADRFRTVADFAAALEAPRASVSRPGVRRAWTALGTLVVLAALVVLALPAIRTLIERRGAGSYGETPRWAAWRGWAGESFPVVAVADSVLIVNRLGAADAEVFDGQRWTRLAIPGSFELRPYTGAISGGRLLATRSSMSRDGQPLLQYWWLAPASGALQPKAAVSGLLPDEGGRPQWWSDGRDLATWLDAIRRLEGAAWVREPTGTAAGIMSLWGNDVNHRFALAASPRDSLLVFDGISWKLVDILGRSGPGHPAYEAGATFRDGATVVVGEECDARERCRGLVLEQRAFDDAWRRVPIPAGIGIPVAPPQSRTRTCDPGRFSLSGVAGASRADYLVWGAWITCDDTPTRRQAAGCPPAHPCTWQVERGRLAPVVDLVGKTVQAAMYLRGAAYALLDDGTLWRRVGLRWRAVTKVPGLPARLVGASERVIVRAVGGDILYEPGRGDTTSGFFTDPTIGVPPGVGDATPPRAVVVQDSTAALLTTAGAVFVSRCHMARRFGGGPRPWLRCPPWAMLPTAPARINAIAFLGDGRLLGIGDRGTAVTWRSGSVVSERLPEAARGDSLWGVAPSPDGGATAIGVRTVLRRDAGGRWTLVRVLPPRRTEYERFAALPELEFAVTGPAIRLWDRSADTLPVTTLFEAVVGDATPSALHVLADGRLVAGFANPGEPTLSGRLVVWASPARANRSRRLDLPLSVDITDLADDGRYLYVAGRGGSLAIRLDSLPFAATLRPAGRRDTVAGARP